VGEVEFPLSFSKIGLGNFTKNKITNVSPAGTTKSLVLIISQSSPAAYIMGNISCLLACPLLGLKVFQLEFKFHILLIEILLVKDGYRVQEHGGIILIRFIMGIFD